MKKFLITLFCICILIFPANSFAASKRNVDSTLPPELSGKSYQQYSANVKTKKYHNSKCRFYDCRDCTKFFKTPEAAQKAGFEACEKCGG